MADVTQGRPVPNDSGDETAPHRSLLSPHWRTAGALTWFAIIGLALLAPALAGGSNSGPYDLMSFFGLGQPTTPIHNSVDSDIIQQTIPWLTLAANQVHQGHLPLWNPYSGAGLPLAFNGQSATFSLPTLLAYLVPVRFAFDVTVIVKLLLAGEQERTCSAACSASTRWRRSSRVPPTN